MVAVMWRNSTWLLQRPVTVARVYSRRVGSDSSAPGHLYTFQDKPRTVEDLPRVSFLELMYRLTFQGFLNRIHELQIYEKQRHGPIYKDALKSVSVTTPKLLEEIMRNDDKFPNRGDMSLWQEHRNLRGFGYGPFTENWYNVRTVLNKRMLHPKDSARYGDTLNGVVTDFIKRMYYLRQCSPTGDLVTNMANELYHFSLEATKLIDKKMEFIQQCLDNNKEVKGEYLTYLLSNTQMSTKDVYGNITELLLAGVDTTSNCLTWTLHLLSMDPQSQDRLYEEVSTFVPADQIPSAAEVTRMPYLKAVIKESLRMYPVVPLNGRVIADKNVTIGGYQFSKNTHFTLSNYAISHDEDTFPESFTFKPERWLRDCPERPNAFGNLPFGFGVRGCVGRRIAELEMYLVLFRLIRQFEVKPDPTMGELKCINRTVLVPDKPVSLHFVDRGTENTA
ncbi:Sterol 26-hydroxylase [Nibea albiflora]|uniref:Sterol 26-hydroxylase n=1 Tax=Nibea albiflora TaxID=240163 RepID=A0ACB7EG38_NIBAL|nr:Sterol 26-hydroxylase [Nibea albiflora]